MRRMPWLVSLVSLVSLVCIVAAPAMAATAAFKLESPALKPGATLTEEQVFNGFGCSGKNLSPALQWSGAPEGTKSFALTLYDPDAPTGSGWWHWVVYNIPASATSLPEGAGSPDGEKLPSRTTGRTCTVARYVSGAPSSAFPTAMSGLASGTTLRSRTALR